MSSGTTRGGANDCPNPGRPDGGVVLRTQRADLPADRARRRGLPRPGAPETLRRDRAPTPTGWWNARLRDDMAPLHFQIEAAWHHAVWGLVAAETGVFEPPDLVGPVPFVGAAGHDGQSGGGARGLTAPDEVNGWAGRDLDLRIGPRRLAFTSEALILSFSLPNVPLPRRHRLRHPALAGRADRQARLRGPAAHPPGIAQGTRSASGQRIRNSRAPQQTTSENGPSRKETSREQLLHDITPPLTPASNSRRASP